MLANSGLDPDTLETVADFEREGLVRLVHAGANIGFGRGCNLGAAHAAHASMRPAGQPAPDFIVFLNPDARLDADAVERRDEKRRGVAALGDEAVEVEVAQRLAQAQRVVTDGEREGAHERRARGPERDVRDRRRGHAQPVAAA